MNIPYLLTTLLYTFIAGLMALDSSLVSFNLLNTFPALRWVRVHFITLGILSQLIFGTLPGLIAIASRRPRPAMRWDIWLTLNAGLVALIAGFAGVNQPLILAGGTLIFIAAGLLLSQLWGMRGTPSPSLKFYIAALSFLLVGIVVGTGIWLNWGKALLIAIPLETHIHANVYGFMSMAFAGLLIDLAPGFSPRPLASGKAITAIFWGMTSAAVLLVLGPWLGLRVPLIPIGLVLEIASVAWLAVLLLRALRLGGRLQQPGAWHLLAAYSWVLLPIVAVPLILTHTLDEAVMESIAPQGLIYAWMLQFGIAVVPYVARRLAIGEKSARLGGSWWSLAAAVLGGLLVWSSILVAPVRGLLYGLGMALFAVALIQPLRELVGIAGTALQRAEPRE